MVNVYKRATGGRAIAASVLGDVPIGNITLPVHPRQATGTISGLAPHAQPELIVADGTFVLNDTIHENDCNKAVVHAFYKEKNLEDLIADGFFFKLRS